MFVTCIVVAALHSKTPLKSSLPSYLNVNLERSDNEEKQSFFELLQFQKEFQTSQDFGLGRFFVCILNKDNGIIYIGLACYYCNRFSWAQENH